MVLHLNSEYWIKGIVQVHSIFRSFMLYSRYINIQQAINSKQAPELEFPYYSSYPVHSDQFTSTRNLKLPEEENTEVHAFHNLSNITFLTSQWTSSCRYSCYSCCHCWRLRGTTACCWRRGFSRSLIISGYALKPQFTKLIYKMLKDTWFTAWFFFNLRTKKSINAFTAKTKQDAVIRMHLQLKEYCEKSNLFFDKKNVVCVVR